jgi:hypothetical protein
MVPHTILGIRAVKPELAPAPAQRVVSPSLRIATPIPKPTLSQEANMAATTYGVNDPLAIKLWSKKLSVEVLKNTWLYKFMGNEHQLDHPDQG